MVLNTTTVYDITTPPPAFATGNYVISATHLLSQILVVSARHERTNPAEQKLRQHVRCKPGRTYGHAMTITGAGNVIKKQFRVKEQLSSLF